MTPPPIAVYVAADRRYTALSERESGDTLDRTTEIPPTGYERRIVRPGREHPTMAAASTARNLTDRVDALAAALRDAGVSPERSAGLLSAAAEATMHAVMLDALLEEEQAAAAPADPAAAEQQPVRLAA
jgi:hypothetical protein